MMLVGYARTSTADQIAGLDAQLAELAKLKVEKIFTEMFQLTGRSIPHIVANIPIAD